jgi:hypothetical protein
MTDRKEKYVIDEYATQTVSERFMPVNNPPSFVNPGRAYEDGYTKGYSDGLIGHAKLMVDDGHGGAKAHYLALKDQLEADHFDDYATVGAVSGRYVVASSRVAAVHAFRLQYGEEAAWTFHIGTTR